MSENTAQELSYQPATKGYSFKAPNASLPTNPESEQKPKNKLPPFLLLAIEILGLSLVFIIFLLVLNFFKIISLPNFSPEQITQSTIASYDKKTGLWTQKGTFYGYDQYVIKIKTGIQVANLKWENASAGFYNSEANLGNSNYIPVIYSLFDLEQAQNIGKNVIVQYKITGGEKRINNLKIFAL